MIAASDTTLIFHGGTRYEQYGPAKLSAYGDTYVFDLSDGEWSQLETPRWSAFDPDGFYVGSNYR